MVDVPRPVTKKIKLERSFDPRIGGPPWAWRVSCVPDWVPQGYLWALVVEPRGPASEAPGAAETFAITHAGMCRSVDGEWHVEPPTSSRTPRFLAGHRWHDLQDALTTARRDARRVEVDGISPAQVIERFAHLDPDGSQSKIAGRLTRRPAAQDLADCHAEHWEPGEAVPLDHLQDKLSRRFHSVRGRDVLAAAEALCASRADAQLFGGAGGDLHYYLRIGNHQRRGKPIGG